MITLETKMINGKAGFASNRRIYTQVKRNEGAAIYERTVEKTGRFDGYEVFRIHIFPKGKRIYQKVYEDDTEHYPSSNEFGKIAWYVTTLDKAEEIFTRLTNDATLAADYVPEGEEDEEGEVSSVKPTPGEYSTTELAEKNGWEYVTAYLFIKEGLAKGTIKFVRAERRNNAKRKTNLYVNV